MTCDRPCSFLPGVAVRTGHSPRPKLVDVIRCFLSGEPEVTVCAGLRRESRMSRNVIISWYPRRDFVASVTLRLMKSRVTFEMHTDPELLLTLAKAGSSPALVRLLDRCRDPLVEQVQGRLGRRLRVKLDIEDLLQDVSLEAYRDIGRFRGSTEREFLCWLRKILATILMNQLRHYFGTARRDLRREQRLTLLDDSTGGWALEPVAPDTSPSGRAQKHERDLTAGRSD